MKRIGLWLAIAALLVNSPRLILVYLRVDGLRLSPPIEAALLVLVAIATGAVLSGGGAYLAHTLARFRNGGLWRLLLVVMWLLMLVFSVWLIAPLLAVGLKKTELAEILNTDRLQWAWSIVAVLAVEILAAGAMIADAIAVQAEQQTESNRTARQSSVGLVTNALTNRLVRAIEAPGARPAPSEPPIRTVPNSTEQPEPTRTETARQAREQSKAEAVQSTLDYLEQHPNATLSEIADAVGRGRSTVAGYLNELEESGRIHRNGNGVRVL